MYERALPGAEQLMLQRRERNEGVLGGWIGLGGHETDYRSMISTPSGTLSRFTVIA